MPTNSQNRLALNFTRPDLARAQQNGGTFSEVDVAWINPREFHRKVIAELENMGYNVARGTSESLELQKEVIGSKTGSVLSRIQGTKTNPHNGAITYKPSIIAGAVCIAFGVVLGLIPALESSVRVGPEIVFVFWGAAVILLGTGIGLLMRTTTSQFLVLFLESIRILSTGEATERTVSKDGAEVTDLFAQLTVSFSGSLEAYVPMDVVKNKSMRQALLTRVPNASQPQPVKSSPLRQFLPKETDVDFAREISIISDSVKRLATTVGTYGRKI